MLPELRDGLELVKSGPGAFLLLDQATGECFQLGARERYLLGLMDGRRTAEDLEREMASLPGAPESQGQVGGFLHQLDLLGFLRNGHAVPHAIGGDGAAAPLAARAAPLAPPPQPLSKEDPKRRLNMVFDLLSVLLGWAVHPALKWPILALALLGATALVSGWSEFLHELQMVYRPPRLPLVVAASVMQTILFLNFPRELMIGVAFRKFGGRLRRFGIGFYRHLLPFFQCDVGDSFFQLPEARRWTVLWTGPFVTLTIGACSLLGWWAAAPDSWLRKFFLVLAPPCVFALLSRLNPLLPYDAYIMLSVKTEQAFLWDRALAETSAWASLRPSPEPLTERERFWFRFYGVGIRVWGVIAPVGLFGLIGWWLTSRFGAPGALSVTLLLLWWYHEWIWRQVMEIGAIRWLVRGGGKWWVRWPLRILAAGAIVACGFIPYSYEIGGKCRLVPVAQHGVRAQIADEIVAVNVKEGDWVEKGQVIASLAARNETANVASNSAALDHARAQLALLRAGSRPEDIRMAMQEVELRQVQLQQADRELRRKKDAADTITLAEVERSESARDEAERLLLSARENSSKLQKGARDEEIRAAEAEVARLEADLDHDRRLLALKDITAPIAGRVITLGIQQRLGQYVQPGDLVAVLQDTSHLRVAVQADQQAAVQIKPGQTVKLRLEGLDGRLLLGKVNEVSTGALPESELDIEPVRSDRESHLTELYTHKDDRFVDVEVELDGGHGDLLPGMTGYARIVISPDVLWRAVARPIVRFFMVEVWSWLP